MTDDHTQPPFHDRLEAGHLVYGAVLADDLSIVESLIPSASGGTISPSSVSPGFASMPIIAGTFGP